MICKECGGTLDYIRESKENKKVGNHIETSKRYICSKCGEEFTTTERMVSTPVIIITSESGYTVFSKTKYQNSLLKVLQDEPKAMYYVKSIILSWYYYVEKTRNERYQMQEGYDYLDYEFSKDELILFTFNKLIEYRLENVAKRYLNLSFYSIEDVNSYSDMYPKLYAANKIAV